MSEGYLLGIDLGTSSLKGSLLNLQNHDILTESVELAVSYPNSFSAEQDPHEWWKGFKNLIGKLKRQLGSFDSLRAIGLSGQMLGLVILGTV